MSVRDELSACGAVPVGEGFNQGSFRTHNTIEGANIENGYCAGVALDWTRRVLQSGNRTGTAYLEYSSPKYATQSRKVATVRRMAKAYGGQSTSYVSETERAKLITRLQQLQNGVEQNWQSYGMGVGIPSDAARLLSSVWQIPGPPNSTFSNFNLTREPSGAITRDGIAALLIELNQMADPQKQSGAAQGRDWAHFANELDTRFDQIRVSETRQTSSRPFRNLAVVRSSPSTNYASAGAWMGTLLEHGVLINCCTVVSMKPTSGSSGHQIAIHHSALDNLILFDPNYGAFRCSRANLENCLQQLFWTPFLNTQGTGETAKVNIGGQLVQKLDADRAVYCRRASTNTQPTGEWKAMGYTVFQNIG